MTQFYRTKPDVNQESYQPGLRVQTIDNLEFTAVYTMQALKIVLSVYFLAKFDTS